MDLTGFLFLLIGTITGFHIFIFSQIKKSRPEHYIRSYLLFLLYFISFIAFGLAFMLNSTHYSTAINAEGSGYSPIGMDHLLTFWVYQILFWISSFTLWLKGEKLPPLTLVLALCAILIGIVLNLFLVLQVTERSDPVVGWRYQFNSIHIYLFVQYFAVNILLGTHLIYKIMRSEGKLAENRSYQNKVLNSLNRWVVNIYLSPIWIFLLTFPVIFIITCILLILGQSPDSMVKLFTETTCWRFSVMSHPEYLPQQGHYLCTVAARGTPELVKPLREGLRHGKPILVNRQLLIANAFEELIEEKFPRFHRCIRGGYDRYGFPLAKMINTPTCSNLTYLLMKPLEYIFLVVLYLFCIHPEEKINRQYSASGTKSKSGPL